jgi:hypothetical protein
MGGERELTGATSQVFEDGVYLQAFGGAALLRNAASLSASLRPSSFCFHGVLMLVRVLPGGPGSPNDLRAGDLQWETGRERARTFLALSEAAWASSRSRLLEWRFRKAEEQEQAEARAQGARRTLSFPFSPLSPSRPVAN